MDHYFSSEQTSAERRRTVEFQIKGRQYALMASGGVFSADRLDPGTAVLLRKADLPGSNAPGPLLDLGCGYGAIACVLATCAPAAQVWAVDVNPRARSLASENAESVGAGDRVRVCDPADVPTNVRFCQIWSNPPVRVGKEHLHEMLSRWLPQLAPEGVAWLVVGRHLGGDSLQRWLIDQGWPTTRHASQKGFRVLRVVGPAVD